MSVHPRSVYAALHEFKPATGGRDWSLTEEAARNIIAEVHGYTKPRHRSTEIKRRMLAAVELLSKDPSP